MDTYQVRRSSVTRDVAVLAALFVVGLGVGLLVTRLLVGEPRVSQVDYAILVAQGFERDQNAPLAVERLRAAGIAKPAETVAAMAQRYSATTPEDERDAQSLKNLASGLGKPVAESAPTLPAGPQPMWIIPLLVLLLALGLGSLLVFRILGVKVPNLDAALRSLGIGRPQATPRPAARRYAGQPNGTANGYGSRRSAGGPAVSPTTDYEPVVADDLTPVPSDDASPAPVSAEPEPVAIPTTLHGPARAADASPATSPATSSANGVHANGVRADGTPVRPQRRSLDGHRPLAARNAFSFRSSYCFGDEPYDEIHPILDRRTRSLAGACGVSAARQLADDDETRYWAFTAWVHDYVSREDQLKAIGIVSKWAYDNCGDEIDEWLQSGEVDELRLVEYGSLARLETNNLAVTISVEEFEYGDGAPPEAYFTRLAAKFDVELHVGASEQAVYS